MTERPMALMSCWDKRGIVPLAESLVALGWDILSTGGTARELEEAGVSVMQVADYTGHPEFLEGRVKTLHPAIAGGILARRDRASDQVSLTDHGYRTIDLVVVNLYPFEEMMGRSESLEVMLETIDVGGATLLRASAKNFLSVTVLSDPDDYDQAIAAVQSGEDFPGLRRQWAAKAFQHLSRYDALIAGYLAPTFDYPDEVAVPLKRHRSLRYGENPHQRAAFYTWPSENDVQLGRLESLAGPDLSYNNLLDIDAAIGVVQEFSDPAVCAVKHTNPCGVAVKDNLLEAFETAYASDPVSIFGGVVAVNRPVDMDLVEAIVKRQLFLEVLVAPDVTADALDRLEKRKKLRVLRLPGLAERSPEIGGWDGLRGAFVRGGLLINDADVDIQSESEWTVAGCHTPTPAQWQDAAFAWRVAKHAKSNAIVVVAGGQTVGVGTGQMNRIRAAELALNAAGAKARGAVLASDGFMPFSDVAELAAERGVAVVVQPGGSLRDADSVQVADANGMAMLFTGRRHFRH